MALMLAGCGGSAERTETVAPAPGPCKPAKVSSDTPPDWAASLSAVPQPPFPHAVASGDRLAAFLFVHPLRARPPRGAGNKILWALGDPDGARSLRITASSDGARSFKVATEAGDAAGQVQRSRITRFPRPGCWRLNARWGPHSATLDVEVR